MIRKIIIGFGLLMVLIVVAVGISNTPTDTADKPDFDAYSGALVKSIMEKNNTNPNVSFTIGDTTDLDKGTYHIVHGIVMWYEHGLNEVRYAVHIGYIDGEYVVGKVLIDGRDVYRNNDNMTLIGAM